MLASRSRIDCGRRWTTLSATTAAGVHRRGRRPDLVVASQRGRRASGHATISARSSAELDRALSDTLEETPVVVDLNGRAYDGIACGRCRGGGGAPVIAVGQHEDIELRKRALGAGAIRVFSYNKLFADGPAVIAKLLGRRAVSTHSIPAARYGERISNAQSLLPQNDASALLIGVGAELQWLTGYAAHALERLTMLVIPLRGRASLIVPRLELAPARSCTAAEAGSDRPDHLGRDGRSVRGRRRAPRRARQPARGPARRAGRGMGSSRRAARLGSAVGDVPAPTSGARSPTPRSAWRRPSCRTCEPSRTPRRSSCCEGLRTPLIAP